MPRSSCHLGPSITDVGKWEEGGVKNWSKLPTDSAKNCQNGRGGVRSLENLTTLFMDGPFSLPTGVIQ